MAHQLPCRALATDLTVQGALAARRIRRCVTMLVLCAISSWSNVQAQDAASLGSKHKALSAHLADNPFGRPLHLQSAEHGSALNGDVHARIDQGFGLVAPALSKPQSWCDILILHLNVKACRSTWSKNGNHLSVNIGRKYDQALSDTYRVDFIFTVVAATSDYLQVLMTADEGPLGTSQYRIQLEVVALDEQHSFMHLSYSYAYGISARAALKTYLSTIGRGKVGFSVVDTKSRKPEYIGGTRGVIERNTMRYYLAIEAYLATLNRPFASRLEARLSAWHAGVERYPAQLHELERDEYLSMKRREVQRQQTPS